MPYAAMPSKSTGGTISLSDYDKIKDNFAAGVPDIFTAKGDIAAATAADTAARVAVGANGAALTADSAQSAGMRWQIRPTCRAYNSAAIDPATSTWVALTFNSERWDTDGVHSTASATGRLTVPANGGGVYAIGGCVQFKSSDSVGGAHYGVRIILNGSTPIVSQFAEQSTTLDIVLNVSAEYLLAAADYAELEVYTTADVNVMASANYSPEFWMTWLRPTP